MATKKSTAKLGKGIRPLADVIPALSRADGRDFKVFFDKKRGSTKAKVLVVDVKEKDSVSEATRNFGKPAATARIRKGIVNLGGMRAMRCG